MLEHLEKPIFHPGLVSSCPIFFDTIRKAVDIPKLAPRQVWELLCERPHGPEEFVELLKWALGRKELQRHLGSLALQLTAGKGGTLCIRDAKYYVQLCSFDSLPVAELALPRFISVQFADQELTKLGLTPLGFTQWWGSMDTKEQHEFSNSLDATKAYALLCVLQEERSQSPTGRGVQGPIEEMARHAIVPTICHGMQKASNCYLPLDDGDSQDSRNQLPEGSDIALPVVSQQVSDGLRPDFLEALGVHSRAGQCIVLWLVS